MARPPWMSKASLTARRMRSVVWYFISAEITDGRSPRVTMAAVTARAASHAYAVSIMRASGSSMPSMRAIGRPNCLRMRP